MQWSHNALWMASTDDRGVVKYWQSNMNNVHSFQAHNETIRGCRWENCLLDYNQHHIRILLYDSLSVLVHLDNIFDGSIMIFWCIHKNLNGQSINILCEVIFCRLVLRDGYKASVCVFPSMTPLLVSLQRMPNWLPVRMMELYVCLMFLDRPKNLFSEVCLYSDSYHNIETITVY